MEQVGQVKKRKGNHALVRIIRGSACGDSCASCNLCEQKERTQWVLNDMGAKEGETVKIEIATSSALLMSFVAYVLPIIIAGTACIFYTKYIESKKVVDALSFVTLALAIFATAKSDKIFFSGNKFKSRITEIIK